MGGAVGGHQELGGWRVGYGWFTVKALETQETPPPVFHHLPGMHLKSTRPRIYTIEQTHSPEERPYRYVAALIN